jgi:hypothetical protein
MRSMELKGKGKTFYHSQFDPVTGTLVRLVDTEGKHRYDHPWDDDPELAAKYPHRMYGDRAWSPVPETVDVSITDHCSFGCSYCYQDSRPKKPHGDRDLVEKILTGFDTPPYQIAIGGGEPTTHPDFIHILKRARELGTVPNFTTAGDEHLSGEIVGVANEVCGGVAMTYHAFKGIDWFSAHYTRLRKLLRPSVQLNVHVIADKDVAINLRTLLGQSERLGPLRVVLLAYYPDVGRATMNTIMTKQVYQVDLPLAIQELQARKAAEPVTLGQAPRAFSIAFSEGLLPYFHSRPELQVDTRFGMATEGHFSCYFDPRGRISTSSFAPPPGSGSGGPAPTVFEKRSQELWNDMHGAYGPSGSACYGCQYEKRCSTPHDFHYLTCAFAHHNQGT